MRVLVAEEFDIWLAGFNQRLTTRVLKTAGRIWSGFEPRPAAGGAVVPVETGATSPWQPPENLRADLVPGDLTAEVASLTLFLRSPPKISVVSQIQM